MEKLNWKPFYFNGNETNIIVSDCGKVSRVYKDWAIKKFAKDKYKYGPIDLSKLKDNNGYIRIKVLIKNNPARSFTIHLIVASAFLNHKIGGNKIVIDHIDSNKKNNNVNNLRVVTARENCSKEKTIKSGLPVGVCYNKRQNCYGSHIVISKKKIFLGNYKDVESAALAYQNKLNHL